MFEPGYYKTNYRAIRLREVVRWHGWYRGIQLWLKTRFKPMSRDGMWMPRLWAENECKPEDLSPDFWQATKPHRADFEKLGFVQCHLSNARKKSDKLFNPSIRDSGGIFYLDSTRCYFGQLIYVQTHDPKRGLTNNIRISFTAAFKDRTLTCANRSITFDSANTGKVVRIDSYDVPIIYNRFCEELQRCPETPRSFPNLESLRQWSDALKIETFQDHVRRGLYVRMTEPEVAAVWAERQRYPAGRPAPLPRRRFRLEYWPAVILLLLLLIITRRHSQAIPDNTIEYQGQLFKTRLVYASYDDYKDDPNNLDTNELGRIEHLMESLKVPESFKDRKTLYDFLGGIAFPGYGWGSGATVQSDDGSTLDIESFEIPQAGKDRVIVVRELAGSLKPVDDFVFETGETNSISRVRLKQHELQYFDAAGKLFRKESL